MCVFSIDFRKLAVAVLAVPFVLAGQPGASGTAQAQGYDKRLEMGHNDLGGVRSISLGLNKSLVIDLPRDA